MTLNALTLWLGPHFLGALGKMRNATEYSGAISATGSGPKILLSLNWGT